jgi:hypothetical protein
LGSIITTEAEVNKCLQPAPLENSTWCYYYYGSEGIDETHDDAIGAMID